MFVHAATRRNGGFRPQDINGWAQLFIADQDNCSLDGSGRVTQLRDLSGNGFHATQSSGPNAPAWSATALNGGPGITGGGTDSNLLSHSSTIDPANEFSVFTVVFNHIIRVGYDDVVYAMARANIPIRLLMYLEFGFNNRKFTPTYKGSAISNSNVTMTGAGPFILTATTTNAHSASSTYNCMTNSTFGVFSGSTPYQDDVDRRALFNERAAGGVNGAQCTLGACGYINRVLTTEELGWLRAWAFSKWNF
jgi:hypothetical protein